MLCIIFIVSICKSVKFLSSRYVCIICIDICKTNDVDCVQILIFWYTNIIIIITKSKITLAIITKHLQSVAKKLTYPVAIHAVAAESVF